MYSYEHICFLKKKRRTKILVKIVQISIFFLFIGLWQMLVDLKLLNSFISSSPIDIIKTINNLIKENDLFSHILITVFETLISFILGTLLGIVVASILWWNKFLAKVFDPYLTILNSLPKVALGPILIIWIGANMNSIIVMALLISVFITIINVYNGFNSIDENKLTLFKSLGATKGQTFFKLVFPGNFNTIISSLKISISMSLVGVIMGELLVSKKGLGYLIMYGSQVFNLNLVMASIMILCIVAFILYYLVLWIEKKLIKND